MPSVRRNRHGASVLVMPLLRSGEDSERIWVEFSYHFFLRFCGYGTAEIDPIHALDSANIICNYFLHCTALFDDALIRTVHRRYVFGPCTNTNLCCLLCRCRYSTCICMLCNSIYLHGLRLSVVHESFASDSPKIMQGLELMLCFLEVEVLRCRRG